MSGEAWSTARRLLAVRLDNAGDVLMTTPAIRALRQSSPGREITLLTSEPGAEAARLVPEIDRVRVYAAPWMKATDQRSTAEEDLEMVECLRSGAFDGAVIFTVYSQSALPAALLCRLAGIPLRLAHARENPYQLLTDWERESEPERQVRHEVRRQLDLVAAIGCATADERLSLRVAPARRDAMAGRLSALGIDLAGRWAIVHAGASAPSRRYPAERFAHVARRLVRDLGWRLVFTGRSDEQALIDEVRGRAGIKSVSLVGQLDFHDLAAAISLSPLLISNNSGPVHVAAAVDTPVVDLYALTNPQHTPWGVRSRVLYHDVPCRNCYRSVCPEGHHACLAMVDPDDVVEAARALLDGGGRPTLNVLSGGARLPTGSA